MQSEKEQVNFLGKVSIDKYSDQSSTLVLNEEEKAMTLVTTKMIRIDSLSCQ
ncbi:MAG: hypothetical protein HOE30_13060 [Deltaproteobacteria bacterium]|jgi:hypothetical protein|nr:hypothetical protein [Deltaproteobacteria bacterium]MBT4262866.1 hypothetical protein [Deltaproteobacteria bacterium]MBT4640929.1 hypothetical protein [Deltaproteobacteria bacterium]MBT6500441.1 hypothetical protein [Deltaproteobacteria bacterium]MBT7153432.1 hypothetical protein [Deltaproteobacteria bacterium]